MKSKFHANIFERALVGLIGREPHPRIRMGNFYHYIWYPTNDEDGIKLSNHVYTIAKWMDEYDIMFSGSRCEYEINRSLPEKGYHLTIMVTPTEN